MVCSIEENKVYTEHNGKEIMFDGYDNVVFAVGPRSV